MHWTACAFSLARVKEGNSIAARIAMIAMTTRNSIRVNPQGAFSRLVFFMPENKDRSYHVAVSLAEGSRIRVSKTAWPAIHFRSAIDRINGGADGMANYIA